MISEKGKIFSTEEVDKKLEDLASTYYNMEDNNDESEFEDWFFDKAQPVLAEIFHLNVTQE